LQRPLNRVCVEDLHPDTVGQGATQRFGTVQLQQIMQLIDVADPVARTAMDDLGQVNQGRLAQVEQLLPLEVAFAPLARDGREERRTMLGQGRAFTPCELPGTGSAGRGFSCVVSINSTDA